MLHSFRRRNAVCHSMEGCRNVVLSGKTGFALMAPKPMEEWSSGCKGNWEGGGGVAI